MRARKYTYIPNAEIESITTWNGKEIPGSKLLDGAYARGKVQYGEGGEMYEGDKYLYDVVFTNGFRDEDINRRVIARNADEALNFALENKLTKYGDSDYTVDGIFKLKKMANGGMMSEGGEIRRFDRHKQMDGETRAEILNVQRHLGNRSLQNYLYGLFDGYDYSQTDSFKKLMKQLQIEDESLYNKIKRIYDKIEQYSFEQMGWGGKMAKGGEVYKIQQKYKYELQPKWEDEKFQTGGRYFLSFKDAQDFKKKLSRMSSSMEYKVIKMANGGMMGKGGYTSRHRKRTLEEKAIEMYGSDWFDLDERTRKELIDDLRIIKGAKGLMVGDKYVATFTLDNGKSITKTYSTKDELDEGIGEMYSDYDVIDVKIEETKAKEEKKEEEKKGIFKLAKVTEKTTPKAKEKRQGVAIEGIESDISRYEELKAIMKNAKAESDLIGGRIKEVGFQKWLELYEQNRTNPNSIDLIDGDENIMLQVKDSYKKVEPEKRAILQENYPDLLETTIVYTIDTTLLDKYGEVLTNLINNSKDIEEKDKDKLVKGESTTTIKSGSVDKLLNYPNPEEVFTLIEPVMALY
jgi:hypothetical protein